MISVFLSSTSNDLEDHRKAVIDALLKGKTSPNAMEYFGAQAGDAIEVSLGELEKCDLFIGIYAYRYGYQPGGGKSITEMEYDYAVELDKPRLVFMVQQGYAEGKLGEHADIDNPDKKKCLEDFKNRLNSERVRALFTSPDSLASAVGSAVLRWFQDITGKAETPKPALPPIQQNITTGDINRGIIGNVSGKNVEINFGDKNTSDKKGL